MACTRKNFVNIKSDSQRAQCATIKEQTIKQMSAIICKLSILIFALFSIITKCKYSLNMFK